MSSQNPRNHRPAVPSPLPLPPDSVPPSPADSVCTVTSEAFLWGFLTATSQLAISSSLLPQGACLPPSFAFLQLVFQTAASELSLGKPIQSWNFPAWNVPCAAQPPRGGCPDWSMLSPLAMPLAVPSSQSPPAPPGPESISYPQPLHCCPFGWHILPLSPSRFLV